jgi:hypothetical protein
MRSVASGGTVPSARVGNKNVTVSLR